MPEKPAAPSADAAYEPARTDAMPKVGQIEPFDAGWNAHALGIARETVRVLAADPGWALLGWDCRQSLLARAEARDA
jgi:hypothetical protein